MTERLAEILISSFPRLVLYCFKATIPLTVCIYALSLVLAFALALIQVQNVRLLKQLARVYVWVAHRLSSRCISSSSVCRHWVSRWMRFPLRSSHSR